MMKRGETIKLRRRYHLDHAISIRSSGYGELWVAHDHQSKEVVIKFINRQLVPAGDEQEWSAHLQAEIDFLISTKQRERRHIVNLLDSGSHEGLPVLVLELMPGNLAEWIAAQQSLPLSQMVAWCRQLCLALAVWHGRGEHYRDLKLSNILCSADGRLLKLADFGLIEECGATTTRAGVGSTAFMAPEQAVPAERTGESEGLFYVSLPHGSPHGSLLSGSDALLSGNGDETALFSAGDSGSLR